MAEVLEASTTSPTELLGIGRRHLAVRDFNSAAEALAKACELLAKEHGDTADQCAEAYLWYGKALLGLSREESGVIGDGVAGTGNADDDDDDEDQDEEENGDVDQKEVEIKEVCKEVEKSEAHSTTKEPESTPEKPKSVPEKRESTLEEPVSTTKEPDCTTKKPESATEETESANTDPESTTKDDVPGASADAEDIADPNTSNGDENDESVINMDVEDDVDNLQLAWEMLDLARSILFRRVQDGGGDAARASLADVHLALGEVALESETYDKAVIDMQSCLDLQKELYGSDDRRIAETHYQIGLANSLASNFEEAITHFKNAANILGTRIKKLEDPTSAAEDATVKKFSSADPFYTIEGEIKELKELLPEIQEKIQDMMDYKAETIKRVRETLCPSNGETSTLNGAGPSTSAPKPAASDISHLIKRKRKSSETEVEASAAKRANT